MSRLADYRNKIDAIDKGIVKLLMLRFKLAEKISKDKKSSKMKIADKKREAEVLRNVRKHSKGSHRKFVNGIFNKIIGYSKKLQR